MGGTGALLGRVARRLPPAALAGTRELKIFNGGVTERCEVEPGAGEEAGPVLHPSQKTARDCAVPHLPVGSVHLPVTMLYFAPLLWSSA